MVEKTSMHVEEGVYPTGIQGCIHNQFLQKQGIPQPVTTTEASLPYQYAGEILAKILLIFTARQLQEQNVNLYVTFVDLTKAFDTVSRDGL